MSFLVPNIAQKSPTGSQVTGQNVDWESSALLGAMEDGRRRQKQGSFLSGIPTKSMTFRSTDPIVKWIECCPI